MDPGELSPSGHICITASAAMAQKTSWKRGWKVVKARVPGSLQWKLSPLEMADKTETTISVDTLM